MNIIGVVGSPRKGGNTDVLIKHILQGASDRGAATHLIHLNDMTFKGCQDCGFCKINGYCKQQDDMTPVYKDIEEADAIIIGSPIYMWNISGQTKLFIDRWYAFVNSDMSIRLKDSKKAILVFTQGSSDPEAFRYVFSWFEKLLQMSRFEVLDTIIAPGVRNVGEIARMQELMNKAYSLGNQLASTSQ
ncbi:MAG: flavodoxin family protein [Syntrophomonas sp.]